MIPAGRPAPAGLGWPAWVVTGLLLLLAAHPAPGAMRTVPRGASHGSPEVRAALAAPTFDGRVEALIGVLSGNDLPAALEAMEALASLGPRVVPRLVSEMRRTHNNWLIGGVLVRMGSPAVNPLVELLEEADEQTTVDCLYLLGEIQDRRAVPTLIRYLEDPRDDVRMYAVSSLLKVGGGRAVEAVLSRLSREGRALEGFIVDCLVRYGRKTVEPIVQALSAGDVRTRREAAYLLGRIGDPLAAEPLAAALSDPDPHVRENAAFALGSLDVAPDVGRYVVGALVQRLGDPVPEVVEAARKSVVTYGPAAVAPLVGACADPDPDVVVAALNALRELGSSEAEPVMIEALRHPDRRVRVSAVAGLIEVGTGRSVEPLLDALRDQDLRWFAGLALEKVGADKPELFLSTSPTDPTMSLRTRILVRLGPAVVPFLEEQLGDDSPGRRAAAVWVLGEIGDPSSAPVLAARLADPDLGWLAGRALHRLGTPGFDELMRYLSAPTTEAGAIQAVEAVSLFDDPRAWDALERAVTGTLPRAARVRAAVLLSVQGEPDRVARLREYLDGEGRDLWPDVEQALRREGSVR